MRSGTLVEATPRPAAAGAPAPRTRPLRVLAITAAYPSPSEPTRGIFIHNLCAELEALRGPGGGPRFEVAVVAPRIRREDPARDRVRGISVRRFTYPSAGVRLKELEKPPAYVLAAYALSGLAAALREARRFRPAVLHAHWVLPAGVIGAAAARLLRVPLVLHAHGSDLQRYAAGSAFLRAMAAWAGRKAARVCAVSGALEAALRTELRVPPERIRRLPMGIDAGLFAPGDREAARAELGVRGAPAEVLFVGDLAPEKGVVEVARAVAGRGAGPPLRLNLAGEGSSRPALEELSARSPERVRLLGRLPPERLALWYRAADLLVLPSRGEGAPVSVMEALASALPVVATAVGGVPEMVRPGREGWLVEAGSTPAAFLKAVEEALAAPGELARIRRELAARGEDRSAVRRARELAALLEEVVHGGRVEES